MDTCWLSFEYQLNFWMVHDNFDVLMTDWTFNKESTAPKNHCFYQLCILHNPDDENDHLVSSSRSSGSYWDRKTRKFYKTDKYTYNVPLYYFNSKNSLGFQKNIGKLSKTSVLSWTKNLTPSIYHHKEAWPPLK